MIENQTHEQVYGGEEYLGFARQKLSVLDAIRRGSSLPTMCRVYEFGSARITVVSADVGNLIRIESSMGGFICHPRDDVNPGGTKPDGEPIEAILRYPLRDDDGGSRVLAYGSNGWDVSSDAENYGNIDWLGSNGEVVSWRGPVGRGIAMDPTKNYPGFTSFDYETLTQVYFTPFRNIVYRGGYIEQEFPEYSKVLGACLVSDAIVTVLSVDYGGRENPEGGIGGFYAEVYYGQERIGFVRSARPTLPCFFCKSGLSAILNQSRIEISESLDSISVTPLTAGSGTVNETGRPYSVSKYGSWPMFRDFDIDTMVEPTLVLSSTDTTESGGGSTSNSEMIDIYRVRDDGSPLVISGVEATNVGEQYTASGGNAPYTWSISAGSIDDNGVITGVDCGSAIITVTDVCGDTAEMVVRFPSGAWISGNWLIDLGDGPNGNYKSFSVTPYPGTSCGIFDCICTVESGRYRYVYHTTCCDKRSTGEYPITSLPGGSCGDATACNSMQNCLDNGAAVFVTGIYLSKWVCQ